MSNLLRVVKPTQLQQHELFQKATGKAQPPKSAIYTNDTPSTVEAVAEFADMGGVLIAYPGTVKQPSNHIQLPPNDAMHCRTRGIPHEVVNNWLKSQLLK